jgi:hypothetical protein
MLPQSWISKIVAAVALGLQISLAAAQPPAESLDELLAAGRFDTAAAQLGESLATKPDDLARTQLGVVQLMQAVQQLADDSYRYGLYSQRWMGAPLLRLPVAENKQAEAMTYDDLRHMIDKFRKQVLVAEQTLAQVEGDMKWPVSLVGIGIDLNADAKIEAPVNGRYSPETLFALLRRLQDPNWNGRDFEPANDNTVAFDRGDVLWLRGYCHVTAATCDMVLAYDQRELFELAGHLVFRGAKTRYDFLNDEQGGDFWAQLPDFIAAIHLIDFRLVDAERMKSAHAHMLRTIELSRESWRAVLAEDDNDREWIAGPQQQRAIESLGLAITDQQAEAWPRVLDETEAILQGEKLLPLWRPRQADRGINLKRVFHEPRDFDLVLWVQQSGAMPFVEQGTVTDLGTWRDFQRTYGGNLLGVSFWLN